LAEPPHLYAIAIGSNRTHGRHGRPAGVVEAAIAELDGRFDLFDASPILLNPDSRRQDDTNVTFAGALGVSRDFGGAKPQKIFANVGYYRGEQTRINVEGTRNVVEAALERKAQRFIHMSSVAAWGPSDGDVIDETTPSRAPGHAVNYFRTKWLSEQEVRTLRGVLAALERRPTRPRLLPDGTTTTERGKFE